MRAEAKRADRTRRRRPPSQGPATAQPSAAGGSLADGDGKGTQPPSDSLERKEKKSPPLRGQTARGRREAVS